MLIRVFKALADPGQRKLLDRLHANNGQTLNELCEGAGMARPSLTKHLLILEQADLVVTLWLEREIKRSLTAQRRGCLRKATADEMQSAIAFNP